MPELFPIGYENEITELSSLQETRKVGYRPGLRFSYAAGKLQQDGKQRIQDAPGVESWRNWCYNCLMTRRYHHLAYSTDFGIEVEEAFAAESREKAESLLTRQITEALQADPYGRTDYVSDIRFDWSAPDAVTATVTVRGIDDVTIDVTANLKGE